MADRTITIPAYALGAVAAALRIEADVLTRRARYSALPSEEQRGELYARAGRLRDLAAGLARAEEDE